MSKKYIISYGFNAGNFIQEGTDIARITPDDNGGFLFQEGDEGDARSNNRLDDVGANWWGYKPGDSKSFDEQMSLDNVLVSFLNQGVLTQADDLYDKILSTIDLGGDLKQQRIIFTSQPIGIFSFAQASKGLIRSVEYYCPSEDRIIAPDSVFKGDLNGKEYYFFEGANEEEILVERRQEGTTDILRTCPFATAQLNYDSGMVLPYDKESKIINFYDKYKLRYTSTTKKVYQIREKKGGGYAPYVDLYCPLGGNWKFTTNTMLVQALPMILLARVLERAGVRTRVFATSFMQTGGEENFMVSPILVKEYGEPLDLNKLAIYSSDKRLFRFHLFNALLGQFYKNGNLKTRHTQTQGVDTDQIYRLMPRVKNYYQYQMDTGAFPKTNIDKGLMIFGGTPMNLREPEEDNLSYDRTQQKIINEFYRISDYVSLMMSKKPDSVIKKIFEREEDRKISKQQVAQTLRNTITQILAPIRRPANPTEDDLMLTDSDKDFKQQDEKRAELLELINRYTS
jgi:hypothetical protein